MNPSVCQKKLGSILERNPNPQLKVTLYEDQSRLGNSRKGKFQSVVRAAGIITNIIVGINKPVSIPLKRIKDIQEIK